jgi:hypothetical protein
LETRQKVAFPGEESALPARVSDVPSFDVELKEDGELGFNVVKSRQGLVASGNLGEKDDYGQARRLLEHDGKDNSTEADVEAEADATAGRAWYCGDGEQVVIRERFGIIEDTKRYFPSQRYLPGMSCSWLIQPELTAEEEARGDYVQVKLTMERLHVESDTDALECGGCDCDYLTVGDGEVALADKPWRKFVTPNYIGVKWFDTGRICGYIPPRLLIFTSSGGALRLSFNSDQGSEFTGFRARFETVVLPANTVRFHEPALYLPPQSTAATLRVDCVSCMDRENANVTLGIQAGLGPDLTPSPLINYNFTFEASVAFLGNRSWAEITVPLPTVPVDSPEAERNAWGVSLWDRHARALLAGLTTMGENMTVGKQAASFSARTAVAKGGPSVWISDNVTDGDKMAIVTVAPVTAMLSMRDIYLKLVDEEQEVVLVIECTDCSGINVTAYLQLIGYGGSKPGLDFKEAPYGERVVFVADEEEEQYRRQLQDVDVKRLEYRIPLYYRQPRTSIFATVSHLYCPQTPYEKLECNTYHSPLLPSPTPPLLPSQPREPPSHVLSSPNTSHDSIYVV